MSDLYLGMAVSNDDCDALASHARNRLQSDRDDRCQDSRRHFPFVATGVVQPALLLRALIAPKEKWEFGSAPRAGSSCFVIAEAMGPTSRPLGSAQLGE